MGKLVFLWENTMSKQKRTRRRFTAEFKAETVKLVKQSDRTMADIAMALGISAKSIGEWVRLSEESGDSISEDERIVAQRPQNHQIDHSWPAIDAPTPHTAPESGVHFWRVILPIPYVSGKSGQETSESPTWPVCPSDYSARRRPLSRTALEMQFVQSVCVLPSGCPSPTT
jgi:hypothetical protein